jgi:hypothetical protein
VDIATLIARERETSGRLSRGHYLYGKKLLQWHTILSVGGALLSGASGSTLIAGAVQRRGIDSRFGWIAGALALLATALTGAQGALRLSPRAEAHRRAGSQFEQRAIDAEHLGLVIGERSAVLDGDLETVHNLVIARTVLSAEMPDLPDRYYERARRERSGLVAF